MIKVDFIDWPPWDVLEPIMSSLILRSDPESLFEKVCTQDYSFLFPCVDKSVEYILVQFQSNFLYKLIITDILLVCKPGTAANIARRGV